ncbi:hypothetical protein ACH5A3_42580 [Streptomyces echinatus]
MSDLPQLPANGITTPATVRAQVGTEVLSTVNTVAVLNGWR